MIGPKEECQLPLSFSQRTSMGGYSVNKYLYFKNGISHFRVTVLPYLFVHTHIHTSPLLLFSSHNFNCIVSLLLLDCYVQRYENWSLLNHSDKRNEFLALHQKTVEFHNITLVVAFITLHYITCWAQVNTPSPLIYNTSVHIYSAFVMMVHASVSTEMLFLWVWHIHIFFFPSFTVKMRGTHEHKIAFIN